MKASTFLLGALLAAPALAQPGAQCIVAGRLDADLWAPKFASIHLFDAGGKPISTPARAALSTVRTAVLDEPALLSQCDGDRPLANADNEPAGRKTAVPTLARGSVEVLGVGFPQLRSGTLVELRVRAPAERVVLSTR